MTMRQALATDLSSLHTYEMTVQVEIKLNGQVKEYTVIMNDMSLDSQLNFGGPEDVGMREIHFKTTDIDDIENGTIITVLEPANAAGTSKRVPKIVLNTLVSACGNELIAYVKGK